MLKDVKMQVNYVGNYLITTTYYIFFAYSVLTFQFSQSLSINVLTLSIMALQASDNMFSRVGFIQKFSKGFPAFDFCFDVLNNIENELSEPLKNYNGECRADQDSKVPNR